MYVKASNKPLARRLARFLAWKAGDAAVAGLSALKGFRVPDEPLQPYIHALPMLLGTYERETLRLMREIVQPGMTVIDGGAHVGYFTVALSRMVGPTGSVLAFEIHPDTLKLLRHNTRHLPNVEVICAALGGQDGMATLYQSNGLSSSNSATASKPGLRPVGELPMRSVCSVLAERGLKRADFIKLDIEGNEPAVLRSLPAGSTSIVFEAKRYIIEAGGETPERLFGELAGHGFSLTTITGDANKANILAVR